MESLDYKNTKLVAHRGLSSMEVENTLPAFLLACQNSAIYGVECDVQITKDNKFVIFHDRTLKRMCGVDKKIKELTQSQICALPMFDKENNLSSHYHIPTLKEYLDLCKAYDKVAVIEIKSKMTLPEIKRLYREIKHTYDIKKVVIISFYIKCLVFFRWLDKCVLLQHICEYKFKRHPLLCRTHNIGYDYSHRLMDTTDVKKYKKLGIVTNVWTVNDKSMMQRYIDAGVDFITSNHAY